MIGYDPKTNRRITCGEARAMQNNGTLSLNPKFGEKNEPRMFFKANYMIHWRPDGRLNYNNPDGDSAIAIEL